MSVDFVSKLGGIPNYRYSNNSIPKGRISMLDSDKKSCIFKCSFLFFFQHMIKYRYVPFSHGKRRYQGKEDSGKVVS